MGHILTGKRIFFEPKNPIGLLSIFALLVDIIAFLAIALVREDNSDYVGYLVVFIIAFPTVIFIFFVYILVYKREVLYAPSALYHQI